MNKKYKIFIAIFIFFLIVGIFSWKNFYKNIAILTNFDETIPEVRYNMALKLAKEKDFLQAQKILPHSLEDYSDRIFELSGDILWELESATGAILEQYQKSIQFRENSRVREKIIFLSNEETKTQSQVPEAKSEEIVNAEERILKDQENRSEFLDPHRASQENFSADMQKIKNLFDWGDIAPVKDW